MIRWLRHQIAGRSAARWARRTLRALLLAYVDATGEPETVEERQELLRQLLASWRDHEGGHQCERS